MYWSHINTYVQKCMSLATSKFICLLFKVSLSVKFCDGNWFYFTYEWKLISIRKTSHLVSLWRGGRHELGTGLLDALPILTSNTKCPYKSKGVFTRDRDKLRPVRTCTGMKFLQLFTENWDEMISLCNKCIADPKAYRLEICGHSLRFVVNYTRPLWTQTGKRVSHLSPVTK